MSIISIIFLILRIIFMLPSLISIGMQIIKLLPKFKEGGFLNDLKVIGEILRLILGIIPTNKDLAKTSLNDLLDAASKKLDPIATASGDPLSELHDKLKKDCEGPGCSMDLVRE